MSWRPLLDGELKDEALAGVRAIVDDLVPFWRDPAGEPSLADGDAGWAILCAGLARSDRDSRHRRIAQTCIERAVAATEKNPSAAGLFAGLASGRPAGRGASRTSAGRIPGCGTKPVCSAIWCSIWPGTSAGHGFSGVVARSILFIFRVPDCTYFTATLKRGRCHEQR
jgi:hypothetical protein